MGKVGRVADMVEDSEQVVGSFGMLEHYEMWMEDETVRGQLVAFAGFDAGLAVFGELDIEFVEDSS